MKTDLEAERMAADAALGIVEEVKLPLAVLAGITGSSLAGHWLIGVGLALLVFFLYGRSESKRHDKAWAAQENEFVDSE